MNFIKRTNSSTGLVEAIAQDRVILDSIEVGSKTNTNGKSYGFFRTSCGKTGIAYEGTYNAYGNEPGPGDEVIVEALASDVANGVNKNWQLALPIAADVDDATKKAAAAFLNA